MPGGRESLRGTVRYFHRDRPTGLAVVDLPARVTAALGGLKQMRVRGAVNGVEFNSNTMPAGGGVLALSVNQALLKAAGLKVGDRANFEIEKA